MGRLHEKVAIITGAAGGQGAAEARLFSREGASVVLTDLARDGLNDLVSELRQAGGRAIAARHDVTDEAQWVDVMRLAESEFGGVNVLVNNAGTISRQGIADTALDAWYRTIDVNLTGPLLGMKWAAPVMRRSGGGSIINVSSTAGLTAHNDAAYCASKWGLRGLTKTAAVEFAEWGVRVNSIHPGVIGGTTFSRNSAPGHAEAGRRAAPLQREGAPDECANVVLFLASDESSYVTGAEIAIDGGYTAGGTLWMRSKLRDALAAGEIV
ncbi:MAG TPA: glucose 1-dehydrogenase [Aliidongia sp.]|uniref:SDR family NAD(P)-dependent oxidoreductase n=1 Tax=Aliidongia sp. TaxID=1914230 RepID=UPI002DDCE232|nr:glucose 1-dehydrogenase [Aliidongia sp.]HEV2673049.1 glucose 1-dehydrogenase [Aliidongia sp.]